jgi:arylsulfatase A-like enzyme
MKPSIAAAARRTVGTIALLVLALLGAVAAGRLGHPIVSSLGGGWAPNLVLISIDTLRADRMSVYGYSRSTTPELERFAEEAVVFDRFFYSGGGTLPSHMTLMTGLNPATHGLGPASAKVLESERETLAESMRARGYVSAAFVDGGWMSGKFGFSQGFDVYDDAGGGLAESLPKARTWLAEAGHRPFLLFLHTYDVHSAAGRLPYDCPGDAELRFSGPAPTSFDGCREGDCATALLASVNSRARRGELRPEDYLSEAELEFISSLYDGCIRYADERLGELFAELRAQGLWDSTVVVVLSDHGEEFLEHGFLLHDQGGYEELAHIPLLIKLPGSALGGVRVGSLAAMVDVFSTLAEILRLRLPEGAQGYSLVPSMLRGRAVRSELHMYSVLRTGDRKYFSDEHRLFDLTNDPLEARNLWAGAGEEVARLERRVRSRIAADLAAAAQFERRYGRGSPAELSAEDEARLRALGYLR